MKYLKLNEKCDMITQFKIYENNNYETLLSNFEDNFIQLLNNLEDEYDDMKPHFVNFANLYNLKLKKWIETENDNNEWSDAKSIYADYAWGNNVKNKKQLFAEWLKIFDNWFEIKDENFKKYLDFYLTTHKYNL